MSRLRRVALTVVAVTVLTAVAGVAALGAVRWVRGPIDDDAYVLLVLGSDQGPPRSGAVLDGRADGFHLLVVSPDRDQVSILSFPRDSYVEVPGFGSTKINASLTRGPDTAVATAERVTGLEVDDWIATGFHGFIAAIDELGGVTVNVESRLYDPGGSSSDLQPGVQTLDGWEALTYVRDRKSRPDGDFGRAESHARMLQALHAQLVSESPDLARVSELARLLRRHTETSIPPARLLKLATLALEIDPDDVVRARVPGVVGTAGSASVVRLTAAAEALFADLRDDGKLDP